MKAAAGEKELYALPSTIPEVSAVRGSVIYLNEAWLKDHGYHDRYVALLDPQHRAVLVARTSEWVDLSLLAAHHRALDALGMSYAEGVSLGRSVAERAHGAMLATLLRLAGNLGASPWLALRHAQKLWERSYRGGGIGVTSVGDNAARIRSVANPSAASPVHRAAFVGAIAGGIDSLCKGLKIEEVARLRTPTSFTLALEWR